MTQNDKVPKKATFQVSMWTEDGFETWQIGKIAGQFLFSPMPSLGLKGYLAKLGPDPGASAGTQKKLEKPDD